MHIRDEKAKLRQAIKERLEKYPEEKRHAEGRTICREILKILPKDPGFSLAAYYPLKDEADLRPLLEELLQRGVKVYLPCFEHTHFVFRLARDLESLLPGEFRIPEPLKNAPLLEPETLDYALVPARAFNIKGQRLGRGNGGYDIWIRDQRRKNPLTKIFGVALECQILPEIPMEPHDETVDGIITARGLKLSEKE